MRFSISGGDHDVHILGASHDPPGIDRQAADDDEFDIRFGQASQQLVEGRFAQLSRAAPVNRISLWLRAMPSARFTPSGRRASSRNRRTRSASAVSAGEGASLSRRFITDQSLAPVLRTASWRGFLQGLVQNAGSGAGRWFFASGLRFAAEAPAGRLSA